MANGGNGKQLRVEVVKTAGPVQTGKTGRNPDGTFGPGNDGFGGGRPKGRRSKIMSDAWDDLITPKRARSLVRMTFKLALKGEAWAVREIYDRAQGKAKATVEIQGDKDIGEAFAILSDDDTRGTLERALARRT